MGSEMCIRDRVCFGGAGPLHANAMGILSNAWPVIIPPGPGVLCARGDATTSVQDEATRTYIKMAEDVSADELLKDLKALETRAGQALLDDGIPVEEHIVSYQADVRYAGQAFEISLDFTEEGLREKGIAVAVSYTHLTLPTTPYV